MRDRPKEIQLLETVDGAGPHIKDTVRIHGVAQDQESAPHNLLRRFPLFSARSYLNLHPDVAAANVDPYVHALEFGAAEGRQLFARADIARALAKVDITPHIPLSEGYAPTRSFTFQLSAMQDVGIDIFVSSLGNIFMKEIAVDIESHFRRNGVDVRILDESFSDVVRFPIFIAPHEFFHLGRGKKFFRKDILRKSVLYNTEQMQTSWFSRAIPSILSARGVIDISPQAAELYRYAGINALHYEPPADFNRQWLLSEDMDHPLAIVLPAEARRVQSELRNWGDRPIDISFFGSESSRREKILSRYASRFARYPSFIYYRRQSLGPIRNDGQEGALTRIAGYVSSCCKISLNIHRDEFPYFEWHRMVRQGMAGGSLVVTDPCLPHPLFKPGIHFLEEEARHVPNLIDWLLNDEDGRKRAQEVISNATSAIADTSSTARSFERLVAFLYSILADLV